MGGSKAGKWHIAMGVNKFKLENNLYSVVNTYTSCSNALAIANTDNLGHYLKADALHDLASRPVAPSEVKQPKYQILYSAKYCWLALANLPEEAREDHIIPVLAHISLISIGKWCNDVFEANFNQHTMAVTEYEKLLFKGKKGDNNRLMDIPSPDPW